MRIRNVLNMVYYILTKYIYRPINSDWKKLYLLSRIKYMVNFQECSGYRCWLLIAEVRKYLKYNYLKYCKNFLKNFIEYKICQWIIKCSQNDVQYSGRTYKHEENICNCSSENLTVKYFDYGFSGKQKKLSNRKLYFSNTILILDENSNFHVYIFKKFLVCKK